MIWVRERVWWSRIVGLIANVDADVEDAGGEGGGDVRPAEERTVRAVETREVGVALDIRGRGVRRLMNRGGRREGEGLAKWRHIVVTKTTGSSGGRVRKNRRQGVERRIGWMSLVGVWLGEGWLGWRRVDSSAVMDVSMSSSSAAPLVVCEVGSVVSVGRGAVSSADAGVEEAGAGAGAVLSWIPYSASANCANRSSRSTVAFPSLPLVQVAQMPASPGWMVGGAVCEEEEEEDFLGGWG